MNYHFEKIMITIQDLEEIGGPDDLDEYLKILKAVKKEVDMRIENGTALHKEEIINYFVDKCGPHLDPDIDKFTYSDLLERYELARKEDE